MKNNGYRRPLSASSRSTCRATPHGCDHRGPERRLRLRHGLGHIWWLAIASFVAIAVVTIAHTFNYNRDFYIPPKVFCVEAPVPQMLPRSEPMSANTSHHAQPAVSSPST